MIAMMAMLLLPATVVAQKAKYKVASSEAKAGTKVIDHVRYRIVYRSMSRINAGDTTKRASDMWLDVGEKVAKLYSRTKQIRDSVVNAYIKQGNFDLPKDVPLSGITWQFYNNYPAQGKTMFIHQWMGNGYKVVEDAKVPAWQLLSDSTKTLLGYACHMATVKLGGREWKAWYTEDVPMSYGPYKLGGLPGLVLEAFSTDGDYRFTCTGMKEVKNGADIVDEASKRHEPMAMKEYIKIMTRTSMGDAFSASGIKIELPADVKGEWDALMKRMPCIIEKE